MTAKEKRFGDEFLLDMNYTQAAIRAGYSESTAKNACYWVNQEADAKQVKAGRKSQYKPELATYINEQLEQMHSKLTADAQEVMEYLTKVMRREMKESVVVTVTKEHSEYVDTGDGKPRKKTVKEEVPQIVEIPAKLSDANKAAELLGKRYSLFTDKVQTEIVVPKFEGEDELED